MSREAEKDLRSLPPEIQKAVARVLEIMRTHPFAGDVKALKGKRWKGIYRRRIGKNYQLFFKVSGSQVYILLISRRGKDPYP